MTQRVNALVLHPDQVRAGDALRSAASALEEAVGLAEAIDLEVVHSLNVRLVDARPSTLFGAGKVEEIRALVEETAAEIVIVNGALSPVQHRNLERAWKAKVLDRTALILEIFGARARTREGRLQVELAHLIYQKSRLVRSWTHLERQRGGKGFLGGPGETQIESDRRAISERIDKLKKQLAAVSRTRGLQRASRKRVPYPVVALVGYTNAGKSTLFNRLAAADVMAKDMLFATLDPTMRAIALPSGGTVILSDTVGFISNLPTQLVAAFRATLEEVREADILVHVRDISHEETEAQKDDVMAVLKELGLGEDEGGRTVIEVANKIDCLAPDDRETLSISARAGKWSAEGDFSSPYRAALSAATGEGVDAFLGLVDEIITGDHVLAEVKAPAGDGAIEAWLHSHGAVLSTDDAEPTLRVFTVRLAPENFGRLRKQFGERADVKLLDGPDDRPQTERAYAAGYRPI